MLIEIAVGDAYGAGFEYVPENFVIKYNNLSCYVNHPWHKLQPGCYTDDTQMSIAIAEAIISNQTWTKEMLADKFVSVFKRDPRKGYSKNFYAFLSKISDGEEFLAEIDSNGEEFLAEIDSNSDCSGAAMRAAPIGIYSQIDQVIKYSEIQASITHNTIDGIRSAVASSLMSHYFVYNLGMKSELPQFIADHVPGFCIAPWQGKVGSKGIMSVSAAITAIVASNSISKLLKNCVAFTGDVDTVAAIALGSSSGCSNEDEMIQDLPSVLINSLENTKYGLDFLRELDKQLHSDNC